MSLSFTRSVARFLTGRLGSIRGLEYVPEDTPCILVANHISYIEPVLLAIIITRKTNRRVYSLTKYVRWKFFRMIGLAETFGMIPVELDHRAKSLEVALHKLHQGNSIMIFPEGTRNFNPTTLLKGKTGAARLALVSGMPVIPVGYRGPQGKSTLQAVRNFARHSKSAHIRFGKPLIFPALPPETLTHSMLTNTTRAIMRIIAELCGKSYPY